MPEFILPAEADHCPYCEAVLRLPPNCCDKMIDEYHKEVKSYYDEMDEELEQYDKE